MGINKVTTPPSQKEVIDKINEIIDNIGTSSYSATCPDLTPSNGMITWTINHYLGTYNVLVGLYDSLGNDVMRTVTINSSNSITVTWNSNASISAGTYTVLIMGGGSPLNITVDSTVIEDSPNAVSGGAVYDALTEIGINTYSATCPTLTPTNGLVNWTLYHNMGTNNIIVALYDSQNKDVMRTTTLDSANAITITWNSDTTIAAGTYTAIVMSGGAPVNLTVDSSVTANSSNPVSSAAVYTMVGNVEALLSEI